MKIKIYKSDKFRDNSLIEKIHLMKLKHGLTYKNLIYPELMETMPIGPRKGCLA